MVISYNVPVSSGGKTFFFLFSFVHLSSFFLSLCTPVLVLVMGKEGTHGGALNKKAFGMAEYLRKVGY